MTLNGTVESPMSTPSPMITPDEQKIIDLLQTKDSVHADELLYQTGIANSQLPAVLLQLEMQGLVKALPGKQYRIN